jgi:predicted Rossmann fold nucleotide-binding protein DprA/Smf involved in DNA uptake
MSQSSPSEQSKGNAMASAVVQSRSTDFASVLQALMRRPMTNDEIETETGVPAEVVAEVLRVLALTGTVARSEDRYTARHIDTLEGELQ